MRLPIPAFLIERLVRRIAGLRRGARLDAVVIEPLAIEVRTRDAGGAPFAVHVMPRGGWRVVLLALAPLVYVTIGRRAALHLRIGGFPYAVDALVTALRRGVPAVEPARATARRARSSRRDPVDGVQPSL